MVQFLLGTDLLEPNIFIIYNLVLATLKGIHKVLNII